MKFKICVQLSANVNEIKRISTAYVEDSRRLDFEELKLSLLKTEEQYISSNNVFKKLNELELNENPAIRVLVPVFLQNFILNEDDYISPCKMTDEAVIAYEQSVIDASNNFDFKNISKDFALFKFILDKAWKRGGTISVDEKNLIEEVRKYLNITIDEQKMLEAKSNRYPTIGNNLHTRTDVDIARKSLQSSGLLFLVKNSDNTPCDVIPEEIATSIREYYGIEIKKYGYMQLINYIARITRKQYFIDVINKFNNSLDTSVISLPKNPTIQYLKNIVFKNIKPSRLIGGFSANDGLDKGVISNWCENLGLSVYGNKPVLIKRILTYYDEVREIEISAEDEREIYYNSYHELACRDLRTLRKNEVISKDLQCEHFFEKATDYLFEIKLKNKPLLLTGTEHPDGKLSFNDKYIMWDNKSKESPVNLKDHIVQFDGYIRNSDKPVAVFIVIGPSFTDESVKECVKYSLQSDTLILLITADELKDIAENWSKTNIGTSFNLGYFKQNGRFNKELLPQSANNKRSDE